MNGNPILAAVRTVLKQSARPMSAKELVRELQQLEELKLGGQTPWKTVGARLAVDIRQNPKTEFMRVGRGLYALREWSDLQEVLVSPRKIHPLEEEILVVSVEDFATIVAGSPGRYLRRVPYRRLLRASRPMSRREAEERLDVVQLIPSFLVFCNDKILTYRRTPKTPESRLHNSYSIVFGGHLQLVDTPALFFDDIGMVREFLFRELREELVFKPDFRSQLYAGILHLTDTPFERQHAGIVFVVDLDAGTEVQSREPGFQSSLKFVKWADALESEIMNDTWSAACVRHLVEG